MVARLHTKELYPKDNVPDYLSLWYEVLLWSVDNRDRTATRANSNMLSSDHIWSGKATPIRLFPFLKPDVCHSKHLSKDVPRAIPCFLLRPLHIIRVSRTVSTGDTSQVATRDVTWKTLGIANEFQTDEGTSGADASRGGASTSEATALSDSKQGRLV